MVHAQKNNTYLAESVDCSADLSCDEVSVSVLVWLFDPNMEKIKLNSAIKGDRRSMMILRGFNDDDADATVEARPWKIKRNDYFKGITYSLSI